MADVNYTTKIARKLQKIFAKGSDNSQMVEFGTPTNGRAVYSKDAANIQTSYYEKGWFPESLSGNIRPYAEDMNGLHYVHSYQLAYLLQAGIPEWDESTPYFTDCVVRGIRNPGVQGDLTGRTLYVCNSDGVDGAGVRGSGGEYGLKPWEDYTERFWSKLQLGDSAVPVGTSLEWCGYGNNPPSEKWKFENGDLLLISEYRDLFEVIGNIYGGDGVVNFRLPNSTGRVAVGYQSGVQGLGLGNTGGSFNHQHYIPQHYHGRGSLNIVSSGTHKHTLQQGAHSHVMTAHQHLFRFGDYSAASGSGVSRLACLGSSGQGTEQNPTKVAWNAQNGGNKLHFYKMTSNMVPNGGGIDKVGQAINTGEASPVVQCLDAVHIHDNASFRGHVGSVGHANGDQDFLTRSTGNDFSTNMPYIVKRKIIRVLP